MEVSESQLVDLYNQKDTDELLELYKSGELTDLATKVLVSVLNSKGVSFEEEKGKTDSGKLKKSQEETPETAQRTIKSSTTGIYVISALQIIVSLGFQFYLGIAFGVLLAILAFTIRTLKSSGASLAVAVLGGIAAIFNFIGPIVTNKVFGNLVLSLITLWLGVRSLRACRILAEDTKKDNSDCLLQKGGKERIPTERKENKLNKSKNDITPFML